MKFRRKKSQQAKNDKKDDILRDNHDDELIDGADEIQTKRPGRFAGVTDAFKFDSHRKMERFIMMFGMASFLFVAGASYSLYHAHVNAEQQSTQINSFNYTAGFSKTASGFKLSEPQLSPDKTTLYLPVTITDTSVISTNANNYNLFISSTRGTLNYKPYAQLLIFGPTGRAVLVFHSATGFRNQPITVYIKNDKELNINSDADNSGVGDTSSDDAIAADQQKVDLAVFKTNLGLPGLKTNSNLKASGNTPQQIYQQLYSSADKAKIDANVKKDQKQLPQQYEVANEMYSRLKKEGYKMPSIPAWMKDNWRPYNAVDPDTGYVGTSNKKVSPSGTVPAISGGSADAVNYPNVLKKKNGQTTNYSNTGQDNINGNASNGSDANTWSTLQQTWNKIHNLKSDIYVQQNANYYSINNNLQNVNQDVSMASPKRFKLLGLVSVK